MLSCPRRRTGLLVAIAASLAAPAHAYGPNLGPLPASMSLHRRMLYMPNPARGDMPDKDGQSRIFLRDNAEDGTSTYLGRHRLDRPAYRDSSRQDDAALLTTYFRSTTGCDDLDLVVLSQKVTAESTVYGFAQSVDQVPILGTYAVAEVRQDTVQYARDFFIKPPRLAVHPSFPASRAAQVALRAILSDAQQARATHGPPAGRLRAPGDPQAHLPDRRRQRGALVVLDGVRRRPHRGGAAARPVGPRPARRPGSSAPPSAAAPTARWTRCPMPHIQWSVGYAADDMGRFDSDVDLGSVQVTFNGAFFRIDSFGNAPMQTVTSTPRP